MPDNVDIKVDLIKVGLYGGLGDVAARVSDVDIIVSCLFLCPYGL